MARIFIVRAVAFNWHSVQLTPCTVYFNLTWKQASQGEDRILFGFEIAFGHGSWKKWSSKTFVLCSALTFSVLVYTLNAHKAGWRASSVQSTCKGARGIGTEPLSTVPPVGRWPSWDACSVIGVSWFQMPSLAFVSTWSGFHLQRTLWALFNIHDTVMNELFIPWAASVCRVPYSWRRQK